MTFVSSGKMATYVTALSEYAKDPNLHPEDIASLRNWLKKQPHLPQHVTDEFLILILHSSEYSIEKAKQLLEKNVTCRTNFTEMFANRDPLSPDNIKVWKFLDIWIGTKATTEYKYRIAFLGLHNFDTDVFDFPTLLRIMNGVVDTTHAEEGVCPGYVLVVNAEGVTLTHLAKTNITHIRNCLYFIQEAVTMKIKAIHVINVSPVVDKIMFVIRPFMKKALLDILYFHSGDMEEFYKAVPRDILPKENGGTMGSKSELIDEVKARLERKRFWLTDQESLRIDESKQTNKKEDLHMTGSFRKLVLD